MKYLKAIKFKELSIGQVFEFESIQSFPNSGMERGPWTKTSSRTYEKPGMDCQVGSINVLVLPIEQGQ